MTAIVTSVGSQLAAARQAQEQMTAARRAQAQAEQRVKLGVQLFKAAEAHLANQQSLLRQVREEQEAVAQELRADVARSLREHDDWQGRREREVGERLEEIERRLAGMSEGWSATQRRVEWMVRRAEALLEGSRQSLAEPLRAPRGAGKQAEAGGSAAKAVGGENHAEEPAAEEGVFGRMIKKMPPR